MPDYVLQATVFCPQCHQLFTSEPISLETLQSRLGGGKWQRVAKFVPRSQDALPALSSCAPPTPVPEPVPAKTPVPVSVPASAPPTVPQLVVPHTCHQCRGAITVPIGKPCTTIDCPLCERRTSVYALLFRCPANCQALLEAPLSSEGQPATCPQCAKSFTIPFDVICAAAPESSGWFTFRCTACPKWLVASKAAARTVGICAHCRSVMEVPSGGYALTERREPAADKFERCRHCQTRIPVSLTKCPRCHLPVPPVEDTVRD